MIVSNHAQLPPSGGDAWVHCSLWPDMNALYPSEDTEKSEEGTAAHWLLAAKDRARDYLGTSAPNGVVIDAEMINGAGMFWNFVNTLCPDLSTVAHGMETRLPPGSFGPLVWGTPDLFLWSSPFALDIVDYKYGNGFVPAFECWQLLIYLCLLLDWYDIDGLREQQITVGLHIVQPRNYDRDGPVRSWRFTASDVRTYRNRIMAAVGEYEADKRMARVGTWCEHCPGRSRCHALQRDTSRLGEVAESATPFQLDPTTAGNELRFLERAITILKARASGLHDEILAQCRVGDFRAGYSVERGEGRGTWTVPPARVADIGRLFNVSLLKEPQPITPRQAVLAGVPQGIVASVSKRSLGDETLVPMDQSKSRKIFGHNSE